MRPRVSLSTERDSLFAIFPGVFAPKPIQELSADSKGIHQHSSALGEYGMSCFYWVTFPWLSAVSVVTVLAADRSRQSGRLDYEHASKVPHARAWSSDRSLVVGTPLPAGA